MKDAIKIFVPITLAAIFALVVLAPMAQNATQDISVDAVVHTLQWGGHH